MDKSDLELFKQALNEGVSNRFEKISSDYAGEITHSERHNLAMRAIVYGKTDKKRTWSPRMKRIVAILVAAALLLTSCGIIFRNVIREVFEELYVKLSYDGDGELLEFIEEVYYPGYVPEGYVFEKEERTTNHVRYVFSNQENVLHFEQGLIKNSNQVIDSETGYSQIYEIEGYEVYYRFAMGYHFYIWSNSDYSLSIKVNTKLTNEEIAKIINGITTK